MGKKLPARAPEKRREAIPASETATPAPAERGVTDIRPWMALPLIGIVMLACVAAGFFLFRTEALGGVVKGVAWQRVISIEARHDVPYSAWLDEIPAAAQNLACEQKSRSRQDSPAPNARQSCATQVVAQSDGTSQAAESCFYEVFDNWCAYTLSEWAPVDQAITAGTDLHPYWPSIQTGIDQREGRREETYTVYFETGAGTKEYTIPDPTLFSQFQAGSEWLLSIDGQGTVVAVSP